MKEEVAQTIRTMVLGIYDGFALGKRDREAREQAKCDEIPNEDEERRLWAEGYMD